MAGIGAWDVPAGTNSKLKIKSKGWKAVGGAIEHKNRPEAIYVTVSSWVKPKLSVQKAQATSTQNPEVLAVTTAVDFEAEVNRAFRHLSSNFDTKYFDQNSIIWTMDYSPKLAAVGKRQFIEFEINIDTVNTIDRFDQPAPNPNNGKVEMYSYKELEAQITKAVDKILGMEAFDERKAIVSFAIAKGAK